MGLAEALIAVGILVVIIAGVFLFSLVFAQDFDPCFIDNDMYKKLCDQQKIDKVYAELLERAREWNAMCDDNGGINVC